MHPRRDDGFRGIAEEPKSGSSGLSMKALAWAAGVARLENVTQMPLLLETGTATAEGRYQ